MRFDDERFDAGALGRREVYIFDVSPTANYPLRVKMACTRLPLLASECGHSLCTRQTQAAKPEPLSDLQIAKAQVNLLSRERDELRGMVAKLEFAAAGQKRKECSDISASPTRTRDPRKRPRVSSPEEQLISDLKGQLSRATEESKGRRDADARELASIQTYGTYLFFFCRVPNLITVSQLPQGYGWKDKRQPRADTKTGDGPRPQREGCRVQDEVSDWSLALLRIVSDFFVLQRAFSSGDDNQQAQEQSQLSRARSPTLESRRQSLSCKNL
ncbi:hypothetical protein B0H14DRAFT_3884411 [Mycena olivaceomarginata]|nr:hypothetical protein B0H14DRAFT_3884411 [Mycena olivaceomarginata]